MYINEMFYQISIVHHERKTQDPRHRSVRLQFWSMCMCAYFKTYGESLKDLQYL